MTSSNQDNQLELCVGSHVLYHVAPSGNVSITRHLYYPATITEIEHEYFTLTFHPYLGEILSIIIMFLIYIV